MDGGGNADFLTAFLDPDDISHALQADRMGRIDVFQHNGELYRLSGGKGLVRLEEYPRAAEIAGDAFAGFKLYWQCTQVTSRLGWFRLQV